MPLYIVRNDITKMAVDIIVNATDPVISGDGGADGAIHKAAGSGLLAECRKLGKCPVGGVQLTKGHGLPCIYVVHTVGPIWDGGTNGEDEILASCYLKTLQAAKKMRCNSIAFPLISSGVHGYPKQQALQIAIDTIRVFLAENEMTVYLTVFDKESYMISKTLFDHVKDYIDDHYVDFHTKRMEERQSRLRQTEVLSDYCYSADIMEDISPSAAPTVSASTASAKPHTALLDAICQLDESFSQMLLRKIDEKGMKDSECYKKANIDRKLFSKIRSDIHYRPSKPTVLAFAIALELSLDETDEMLKKAGFALSHSCKFDVIVEYFISMGNYDIFEINQALFAFDQCLLGE